jgi:hypothetical protein
MTTELIRQKLHEYIDTASEEDLEVLYYEVKNAGPLEWSEEFTAEMEERRQDYLSGKEKTVSAEEAMEYALNPSARNK